MFALRKCQKVQSHANVTQKGPAIYIPSLLRHVRLSSSMSRRAAAHEHCGHCPEEKPYFSNLLSLSFQVPTWVPVCFSFPARPMRNSGSGDLVFAKLDFFGSTRSVPKSKHGFLCSLVTVARNLQSFCFFGFWFSLSRFSFPVLVPGRLLSQFHACAHRSLYIYIYVLLRLQAKKTHVVAKRDVGQINHVSQHTKPNIHKHTYVA